MVEVVINDVISTRCGRPLNADLPGVVIKNVVFDLRAAGSGPKRNHSDSRNVRRIDRIVVILVSSARIEVILTIDYPYSTDIVDDVITNNMVVTARLDEYPISSQR